MRSQSLYSILFVYKTNMVSIALQDIHGAHIGLRKNRVQLNNKKSCICAGNRLVCWHQIHRIQ